MLKVRKVNEGLIRDVKIGVQRRGEEEYVCNP